MQFDENWPNRKETKMKHGVPDQNMGFQTLLSNYTKSSWRSSFPDLQSICQVSSSRSVSE